MGLLGGIVVSETTGNLIDGHRRILALDQINKYDGTPDTDYDVKVELAVFQDEKEEKEQMTYQAIGNTRADFNLIARYIGEVDPKEAGIGEDDYKLILELGKQDAADIEAIGDMGADFLDLDSDGNEGEAAERPTGEKSTEEVMQEIADRSSYTADEIREKKRKAREAYEKSNVDDNSNFVVLSFVSEESKMAFCELMGVQFSRNIVVSGEEILERLDM